MRTLVLLLLALVALTVGPPVQAGSCCVGSTTGMPTQLGPCETWSAGVGTAGERSTLRWDAGGRVVASSLAEQVLTTTLGVGWRWSRTGQLGVTMPWVATWKQTDTLSGSGSGLGDLQVTARLEPWEESGGRSARGWRAVPSLSVGVRLPTGRTWEGAQDPLAADVTGRPGLSLTGAAVLQHTQGSWPWSVGVDGELSALASEPSSVGLSATLGRTLTTRWTAVGLVRHQQTLTRLDGWTAATARTQVGLRAVHGSRLRWRAWGGVLADVPVPGLGRDQAQSVVVAAGALLVR